VHEVVGDARPTRLELALGEALVEMAPELVTQIRDVLGEYETRGGRVQMVTFDGSGHGPPFDAADRWAKLFWEHVASAG